MDFKQEVCEKYGVRMHKKQKRAFRDFVQKNATEMGYDNKIQKGLFAKNIVVGDVDKAEVVFTAHYDTPPKMPRFYMKHMFFHSLVTAPLFLQSLLWAADLMLMVGISGYFVMDYLSILTTAFTIMTPAFAGYIFGFLGGANKHNFNDNSSGCLSLLNLMKKYKSLPKNLKEKVAFVFTDNEEKFLLGSIQLKNKTKNYKNKTFINFDCVGKGKNINLFHVGKPTKIAKELEQIIAAENGDFKAKAKYSGVNSMSDHFPVRKANHVCLLNTKVGKKDSLMDHIHTKFDKTLDDENIDFICNTIGKMEQLKELENYLQLQKTKETQLEMVVEKQQEKTAEQQNVAADIKNHILNKNNSEKEGNQALVDIYKYHKDNKKHKEELSKVADNNIDKEHEEIVIEK